MTSQTGNRLGSTINNCLITNPAEGDVPSYQASTGLFINRPVTGIFSVTTDSSLMGAGIPGTPLGVAIQGVSPGSYTLSNVTVNNRGIITAISNGTALTVVNTDASLTGNGTLGSPLQIAVQGGVTPGSYTNVNLTVDSQGIVTAVSSGATPGTITTDASLSGVGTVPSPLKIAVQGGITPGAYTNSNLTVDSQGIITAIANGSSAGTIHTDASLSGVGSVGSPLQIAVQGGITPGSYTLTNITVNSQGIVTAAANGTAVTSVASGTGLTGGPITTTGTLSIANTAVTAGSYTAANITVNAQGQLTAASNGTVGSVTNIATGTGLTGGPITTTGTISIANTAVTAGSYTSANITVNAQGQITAATNGSGSGGTVTNIATGTGLTGGPITSTGTISIANTAVTAGTYNAPALTVNAQGQLTNAANIITTAADIMAGDPSTGLATRIPAYLNGSHLMAVSGTGLTATDFTYMQPNISIMNTGMKVTVAANALTIQLVDSNGNTLTGVARTNNGGLMRFRNQTATNGYSGPILVLTSPSALNLTIPSGTTIGTTNNYAGYIYVYLTQTPGGASVTVSLTPFALDGIYSTTAISGGSSATTLYSQATITNQPIQYIGKFIAPQTTAGIWASAPTQVYTTLSGNDYAADWQPVTADGTTITGNGLPFNPLTVPAGAVSVDTDNTSVIGNGTTGNPIELPIGVSIPTTGATAVSVVTFNQWGVVCGPNFVPFTHATLQTTNATPTNFVLLPTVNNSCFMYRVVVVASVATTSSNGTTFTQDIQLLNDNGVLTVENNTTLSKLPSSSSWNLTGTGSGTSWQLIATGAASTTINWTCWAYGYETHA